MSGRSGEASTSESAAVTAVTDAGSSRTGSVASCSGSSVAAQALSGRSGAASASESTTGLIHCMVGDTLQQALSEAVSRVVRGWVDLGLRVRV